MNFEEITISGAGFRKGRCSGILPMVAEKPIGDVLEHSIYTMLTHFNMNIPHSEHVFDLSLQLPASLRCCTSCPVLTSRC